MVNFKTNHSANLSTKIMILFPLLQKCIIVSFILCAIKIIVLQLSITIHMLIIIYKGSSLNSEVFLLLFNMAYCSLYTIYIFCVKKVCCMYQSLHMTCIKIIIIFLKSSSDLLIRGHLVLICSLVLMKSNIKYGVP